MSERFSEILDTEQECRLERTGMAFGMSPGDRERAKRNHANVKARLYALLDGLSLDELKAYAAYRREHKA
jgi:hypothetical protein